MMVSCSTSVFRDPRDSGPQVGRASSFPVGATSGPLVVVKILNIRHNFQAFFVVIKYQ